MTARELSISIFLSETRFQQFFFLHLTHDQMVYDFYCPSKKGGFTLWLLFISQCAQLQRQ